MRRLLSRVVRNVCVASVIVACIWALLGVQASEAEPDRSLPQPSASVDEQATTDEADTGRTPSSAATSEQQNQSETIQVIELPPAAPVPGRASTQVSQRELRERQPRSAPDALRYEPGVFVQQTSSGQGSPFLRGRTGQQTVLLFDGIRLNNSLYRQGPNQYFFTIDLRALDRINVIRGGAATLYGSDAIAGVLDARPAAPRPGKLAVRPSASLRGTTADDELGGRAQADAAWGDKLSAVAGIGYRHVGLLESGGPVLSPITGEPSQVPRFDEDGRTQLGTGFDELSFDARTVYRPTRALVLTGAVYGYRQTDAPRTDQCPPPFAPTTECLTYDEQFHTLAYLSLDGDLGRAARQLWIAASVQHQRERRTRDRPTSNVQNGGRDEVLTYGLAARATSDWRSLGSRSRARVTYGGDLYYDQVSSSAWTILTEIDYVSIHSRGQYLEGSRYGTGGLFGSGELSLGSQVTVRGGGRVALAMADAPADPQSGTAAVNRSWRALVGHLGAEYRPRPRLALFANVDRAFRAPNLDDLTSRQATGPGFQFENSELQAEVSATGELGAHWNGSRLQLGGWAYVSRLRKAIARDLRAQSECPMDTPACDSAWYRYQLVNVPGSATIIGAEAFARALLPRGFDMRGTISYAWGESPNPQQRPSDPSLAYQERVPLSRIPPLNGSVELRWHRRRWMLAAGLRWALLQDRLALSDQSDERIPRGGTPGFSVVELRAGYELTERLRAHLVFENMFDAAYRYHGSSVNGPGRGLIMNLELGL